MLKEAYDSENMAIAAKAVAGFKVCSSDRDDGEIISMVALTSCKKNASTDEFINQLVDMFGFKIAPVVTSTECMDLIDRDADDEKIKEIADRIEVEFDDLASIVKILKKYSCIGSDLGCLLTGMGVDIDFELKKESPSASPLAN
jgi:hypothetical protein